MAGSAPERSAVALATGVEYPDGHADDAPGAAERFAAAIAERCRA